MATVRWIHARAQTYFEGEGAARTAGAHRRRHGRHHRAEAGRNRPAHQGQRPQLLGPRRPHHRPRPARSPTPTPRGCACTATTAPTRCSAPTRSTTSSIRCMHARMREALYRRRLVDGRGAGAAERRHHLRRRAAVNSVTTADGRHVAFLGSIEDVTERKQAEAQVRRSEAMLRSVFEASKDAIVVTKAGPRRVRQPRGGGDVRPRREPADCWASRSSNFVPESERPRVLAINQAREQGPAGRRRPTKPRGCAATAPIFDAEISASDLHHRRRAVSARRRSATSARARRRSGRCARRAERLSKVFNSTSDAQILHRVEDDGRLVVVSANDAYHAVRAVVVPRRAAVDRGTLSR